MVDDFIQAILFQYNYFIVFWVVVAYFLLLYFALGPVFLWACKRLAKKGWVEKITDRKVQPKQLKFEIKHSVKSIFIFGASSLPLIYFIRVGTIELLPNTFFTVLIGLIILNFWNELHFFIVHRIMHISYFMKRVHYVHHKSKIPTVYSVYSFHWLEAFLLSTVPLSIAVFIPFSPLAILLYPTASILLNYAGHCNYRFGNGEGNSWRVFGTHHNQHHAKGRKNYGFAINWFDKLHTAITNKNNK